MNLSMSFSHTAPGTSRGKESLVHHGRPDHALDGSFLNAWRVLAFILLWAGHSRLSMPEEPTDTNRNHFKTWLVNPQPFDAVVRVRTSS